MSSVRCLYELCFASGPPALDLRAALHRLAGGNRAPGRSTYIGETVDGMSSLPIFSGISLIHGKLFFPALPIGGTVGSSEFISISFPCYSSTQPDTRDNPEFPSCCSLRNEVFNLQTLWGNPFLTNWASSGSTPLFSL